MSQGNARALWRMMLILGSSHFGNCCAWQSRKVGEINPLAFPSQRADMAFASGDMNLLIRRHFGQRVVAKHAVEAINAARETIWPPVFRRHADARQTRDRLFSRPCEVRPT